ncbi:MAG: hypothetical protein L0G72_11685 [Brevibacterium aurantiacum]|nr:hypothetical protein [Brevibacterium aurantiacum]
MTTISTAIASQADADLIRAIDTMPVWSGAPWIEDVTTSADGQSLIVTVWDDDEQPAQMGLSADQLREAITTAEQRGYRLCCAEAMQDEGIEYGCPDDLDTIIQTAAYGRIIFA